MDILCVTDIFGHKIRLTEEWWRHILAHHPIMEQYLDHIKLTLAEPNTVQHSLVNENEYRYYRLFDEIYGGMYVLVAVIKDVDNFIVTAFVVRKIREGGKVIWLKR